METLTSESVPDSQTVEAGDRMGQKYIIEKHLGAGATGHVYLAEHTLLARKVALKVLHTEFCQNQAILERFIDEARMLALIKSQHVVQVVDAEVGTSRAFIAMEYVDGVDLGEFLRTHPELALETKLDLARQIALGLAVAHQHGIVHRDIKPENVLLTRDENNNLVAKVADFGVAKQIHLTGPSHRTQNGAVLGTPLYMAPEQFFDSSQVDQRADIFSLGVLIYEMCSGCLPFEGSHLNEIARSLLTTRPIALNKLNSSIPKSVSSLVDSCLQLQPDRRIASAAEVAVQLALSIEPLARESQRGTLLPSAPLHSNDTGPDARLTRNSPRARSAAGAYVGWGLAAAASLALLHSFHHSPELQKTADALGTKAAQRLNLVLTPDALPSPSISTAKVLVSGWELRPLVVPLASADVAQTVDSPPPVTHRALHPSAANVLTYHSSDHSTRETVDAAASDTDDQEEEEQEQLAPAATLDDTIVPAEQGMAAQQNLQQSLVARK